MKRQKKEMLDLDLSRNVASATECTGLMPTPPENAEEYDSYLDLQSLEASKVEKKR